MTTERVRATRQFSNALVGSKDPGEEFDYDLAKDPAGLKADGFIEKVGTKPKAD